jgi:subtilisin-like proprotein convertase family protein
MKKKLTIVVLLLVAVFFISYFINLTSIKKAETIDSVTLLREKHTSFLNNSPFKETLNLSKKERKAQGLPPNKYYERMWELTMNPATGKPEPNKVLELQKNRSIKQKSLSAKNPGDAVSNSWEERGPNNIGGRTRVVLFDPNDPTNKRVFAGGVSGGLWKNEDITSSNSSWTLIPDVPGNMNISCITVDPNNPLVWYIGTGEQYTFGAAVGNGVYKTTNGGVTWTNIPVQLAGGATSGNNLAGIYYINDIVAWNNGGSTEVFIGVGTHVYGDAANPTNWLGFQNAGLYKTLDDGLSWNRIETSVLEFTYGSGTYYCIPNNFEISANNTLWFGTIGTPGTGSPRIGGGRVFSSTDGIIWSEAGASPLPNSNRVELAVSSSNPSKLYALTEGTTSAGPHIYATTNAFNNFTELAKPEDADFPYPGYDGIPANDFTRGQDFYNLVIEIDPTNDNIVYVGGIDLFRTTQGENTNLASEWEQISKWSNNSGLAGLNCSLVHADQHAFTFRPGSSNEAVIGNDGGVYYANGLSTSATTSNAFSARNKNYNVTQFYYGGYGPNVTNELIIAGAQDNGTQFFNGAAPGINSSVWANGGDGAYSEIDTDEDYMIVSYVYNNYKYLNLPNYQTGYSLNNGSSGEGDFINQAGLDHNLNILFSNGSSSSFRINRYILGSSNATKNQLNNALLTNAPTAFKVSPYTTASTTLLVGTADGKLLKLTNAESTNTNAIVWEELSGGLFLGSISDIEFGATEDEIFVTFHNYGVTSIWYTLDGGTNWLNKEGNLPDMPVKCILQNPLVPNEVILGTELGVWATSNFNDVSPNWISSYNGMQDVKVVDLDLRSDNTVLATTFGRGVFTGKFLATDFTISTLNSTVTTCNNTAVFNFDFNTNATYNTLTTFSTSGEPAGVTINFSPSSLNTQGTFSMTVSNISSLALGDYPITVIGTGNDTSSIDVILRVDDDTINIVNPTSPLNEATGITYFGTNFAWDADIEATSYDFDIATDAGFNTVVESTNIETNSFTITNSLNSSTVYYWRVRSKNECITADYSDTQKFQTNTSQCISESISPNLSIPDGIEVDTPGAPLESIINIPNNFAISDVNVAINISHTYIEDLIISLIAPDNTEVILFNRECNSEDDIDVVYNDDAATIITCASPVSGTAIPTNLLSAFNSITENSQGNWTLKIEDYYNADQGTLNSWSIELCENQSTTNSNLTKADPINVNSTIEYSLLQTDLNATSAGSTNAEQIYMLVDNPIKGDLKLNGTPLNIGDTFTQDDINNGFVSYLSTSGVTTTDAFKIDITNATNGFLPNQQININIDATPLSVDNQFFKKTKTLVFPTVSNGEFSIISNTSLGKTTIEIFNINGQRVYMKKLNFRSGNKENIITNGLASGVYILKLSAESAQGTKKIIIK